MDELQKKYPDFAKLFLQVQNVSSNLANRDRDFFISESKEGEQIEMDCTEDLEGFWKSKLKKEFPIKNKLEEKPKSHLSSTLNEMEEDHPGQLFHDLNGNSRFLTSCEQLKSFPRNCSTPNLRQDDQKEQTFLKFITKLDLLKSKRLKTDDSSSIKKPKNTDDNISVDSKVFERKTDSKCGFDCKDQNTTELKRADEIHGLSDSSLDISTSNHTMDSMNKLAEHLKASMTISSLNDDYTRDHWPTSGSYSHEVIVRGISLTNFLYGK